MKLALRQVLSILTTGDVNFCRSRIERPFSGEFDSTNPAIDRLSMAGIVKRKIKFASDETNRADGINGELTWRSSVSAGAHQFLGRDFVLRGHQFVDGILVLQKDLHADEWFAALLRQHVPRFGTGQQVRDGALGQSQYGLSEQTLTDGVLAQLFFHLQRQ